MIVGDVRPIGVTSRGSLLADINVCLGAIGIVFRERDR